MRLIAYTVTDKQINLSIIVVFIFHTDIKRSCGYNTDADAIYGDDSRSLDHRTIDDI